MQEEKEQELQETVGEENSSESTEVTPEDSEKSTELIPEKVKSESKSVDGQSDKSKGVDGDGITEEIDATHSKDTKEAELPSVESAGNKEDVLEEIDGPMLKYGIQSLNKRKITLPRSKKDWPDRERLDFRFQDRFRQSL